MEPIMESSFFSFLSLDLLSWTTLLYTILVYVIVQYFSSFISTHQFHAFELKSKSSRPIRNQNKLPWGIDSIYKVIQATGAGADLFDDIIVPRFHELKTWTMEGTGIFGQQIITTAEPRNVQAVFATNFKDYVTGPTRAGQFGALLGHRGIFTLDGEEWARARKMFRPVFRRGRVNDLEGTGRAAGILISVLPMAEKDEEGGRWTEVVDLMPYFYRFTLDTATGFLFGKSVESQSAAAGKVVESGKGDGEMGEIAAGQEFSDAFQVAQEWLGFRIRVQKLYLLVDGLKWRRAVKTVRKFVNHYVQQALEQSQEIGDSNLETEEDDNETGDYNLLRELVRETRDPIELRDQILGVLLAGRDTTAGLLTWTLVELAQNPDLYATLRESILSTFGPTTSSPTSSTYTPLTFATLKSHHPLQNVLSETLRLHPIVPINNRLCIRNTVLPVGGGPDGTQPIAVRKGQLVNFIVYLIQRRKDIWGEDAEEWKPDRWEKRKVGWEFVPFSGGARVCLGQQYALTEASYLLVRLLQTFDRIEWAGEEGKVRKAFGLTMFPAHGCKVRLRKAID